MLFDVLVMHAVAALVLLVECGAVLLDYRVVGGVEVFKLINV